MGILGDSKRLERGLEGVCLGAAHLWNFCARDLHCRRRLRSIVRIVRWGCEPRATGGWLGWESWLLLLVAGSVSGSVIPGLAAAVVAALGVGRTPFFWRFPSFLLPGW